MITPLGNANYAEMVNVELKLNLRFLKISLSKGFTDYNFFYKNEKRRKALEIQCNIY